MELLITQKHKKEFATFDQGFYVVLGVLTGLGVVTPFVLVNIALCDLVSKGVKKAVKNGYI